MIDAVFNKLRQAGINPNGWLIADLTPEKVRDEHWMSAFIKLHRAGVGQWIAQYLTVEKARNDGWVGAILKVRQADIELDYRIAQHLTIGRANDQRYIDLLIANQGEMEKADLAYLRQFYPDIPPAEINYPPHLFKILQDPRANELIQEIVEQYLRDGLLRAVRQMNDLHEATADKRLAVIKDYNLDLLYRAVVLGNEEVYTSTFNLIFDGMDYRGREKECSIMAQMKKENIDGYDLLKRADTEKKNYKIFLRTCAQYGKLNAFLSTIKDPSKKEALIADFAKNLDQSDRMLSDGTALAETMTYLSSEQNDISVSIEKYIKQEHERLGAVNPEAAKLYGIIASLHANQAQSNAEWFRQMQEKYQTPDLSKIEEKEVFVNNVNVQEYFFYNDQDGKASFENFLRSYKNDRSWKIADHQTYLVIEKIDPQSGRKIMIFANKPEADYQGVDAVQEAIKKENLMVTVVIHRGHSYHVSETIGAIPPTAKIVVLGSCGGFNNVDQVLAKAPRAHILATKGRGTLRVNDPLLVIINTTMIKDGRIDWPALWQMAGKKINEKEFAMYTPPQKNIGAILIVAFKTAK